MKYLLLGIVALAAGFVVGRHWGTSAASAPAASPASLPSSVSLSASPRPAVATSAPAALTKTQRQQALVDTLRWLAEAGWPNIVRVLNGDKIDPALVRLVELDANETARLEAAFAQASGEIDALRAAQAKIRRSDSGDDVIVDVPGIDAATSATIYDRTMAELDSVLDADRAALFRSLAGDTLATALDRFGLNGARFTISFRPTNVLNGEEQHRFARENLDVEGRNYTMSGKTSLARLREMHPELSGVLRSKPAP